MKVLAALLATAVLAPVARAEDADVARVKAVVDTYLHGLKFNDVESFKKAFWPGAKLFFVKKSGELGELSQEAWYKGFASVAGQEEKGTLAIESAEVTGKAASVKVREVYPKEIYVDYLSLLKLSGEWRIVNKIYDVQPAPADAK